MTEDAPTSSAERSGWLYGPVPDLLLGCGVGYALTVPLLAAVGMAGNLSAWPVAVAALITMLTAGPHYGATMLRVLEQPEDRYKYAFFFFLVTAGLTVAFLAGLYHFVIGSWILTIYATWSPWHFAGQNYGLALMFLRRRQIAIDNRTKRLFHLSFVLSFLLAAFAIHTENSGANYAPGTTDMVEAFTVLRLGIPAQITGYLAPLTAALYLYCLVEVFQRLRGAGVRALVPTGAIVLTQATWYTVPALARIVGGVSMETLLPFTVIWISVAHSVQYLWITSYYARRADPTRRFLAYLVQTMLMGSLICVVPWMAFAPGLLGSVPWDAGLALLAFSVINLHHFLLDGAIWKLRDGLVARALLLQPGRAPGTDADPRPTRRGVVWPVVWTVGAIGFGISVFSTLESEFGLRQADDIERAQQAAGRLRWIGRDLMSAHAHIGSRLEAEGRDAEAIAAYQRSLELFPSPEVWAALGAVQARDGDLVGAVVSLRSAVDMSPDDGDAHYELGRLMPRLLEEIPMTVHARQRVLPDGSTIDAADILDGAMNTLQSARDEAARQEATAEAAQLDERLEELEAIRARLPD